MKRLLRLLLLALLIAQPAARALALGPFQRVGIMTATEPELEPFLEGLQELEKIEAAGRTFRVGRLEGTEVVLVQGGVGKVNAALTATMLISRFRVDLLLFSGVGAGLDEELGIGDVVVSTRTAQTDAVRIADRKVKPLPIKRLDHDGFHRSRYVAAPTPLVELALEVGGQTDFKRVLPVTKKRPQVVAGTICTGDAFVADEQHSQWMRRTYTGSIYEMEGGAVSQVARASGTPWLVIRGVSDHSNGLSSLTYPVTRGRSADNAALLILNLLARLQGR